MVLCGGLALKVTLEKVMLQINKKRKYGVIAIGLMVISALLLQYKEEAENVGILERASSFVVVVDAGHGGFDPGKVGCDGTLEKDINLAIALQVKALLEKENVKVIMTRTEDKPVGQTEGEITKLQDMKARVEMINTSGADLAVSIHQNSFTEESSKGAQVFYHGESEEGAELAKIIQEQIKIILNDGNHRMEKADNSYYMLKKTTCPIVIVECGFLSNYAETALLKEEAYQKKVAQGVVDGVMKYLEERNVCKENVLVI